MVQLADRNREVESMSQELSMAAQTVETLEREVKRLMLKVAENDYNSQHAVAEAAALRGQLSSTEEALAREQQRVEAVRAEGAAELAAANDDLARRARQVSALEEELAAANQTVAGLEREVQSLMGKVVDIDWALSREREAGQGVRGEVESLRSELWAAQEELARERRQVEALKRQAQEELAAGAARALDEARAKEAELVERAAQAEQALEEAMAARWVVGLVQGQAESLLCGLLWVCGSKEQSKHAKV